MIQESWTSLEWVSCILKLRTQGSGCCFRLLMKWIHVLWDNIRRLLIELVYYKHGRFSFRIINLFCPFSLGWRQDDVDSFGVAVYGCVSPIPRKTLPKTGNWEHAGRFSDNPHFHECWRIEPAPDLRCDHTKAMLPLVLTFYFPFNHPASVFLEHCPLLVEFLNPSRFLDQESY